MSLYTFKERYLREAADKTVTINFGRFNPPTIGHEKLLDISMKKGTGDHRVYATQTSGNKKNPLDWKTKIKYMRKVFPKHARHILMDKKVKDIWDVAVTAYNDGYTEFELVVIIPLNKYNEFDNVSKNKVEGITIDGFSISDIRVKDPNNPANLIDCKLIEYSV